MPTVPLLFHDLYDFLPSLYRLARLSLLLFANAMQFLYQIVSTEACALFVRCPYPYKSSHDTETMYGSEVRRCWTESSLKLALFST